MASSLELRKVAGGVPVHLARLLRASSVAPTAVHGKCYLSTETDMSPHANENRRVDVDRRSGSSIGRRGESFSGFALTTAITDWSSMLYSIIYTALPTIVVGILDKDLSRTTLSKYPQLYGAGQKRESYNGKLFWQCWTLCGKA
ncbi:putative phospholipid-transporting ATPase 12 [Primulina tabacum]|uniref:putative phospholipid-transporting ATPase 12 n=1 Tax=Primulina tabacum TaxID=48773 RepID=UPI003F5A9202